MTSPSHQPQTQTSTMTHNDSRPTNSPSAGRGQAADVRHLPWPDLSSSADQQVVKRQPQLEDSRTAIGAKKDRQRRENSIELDFVVDVYAGIAHDRARSPPNNAGGGILGCRTELTQTNCVQVANGGGGSAVEIPTDGSTCCDRDSCDCGNCDCDCDGDDDCSIM